MGRYANEDDLVPGLGTPSIHGGPWDAEAKRRDVAEVFRIYVEEAVAREGRCVFCCVNKVTNTEF